MLWFSASARLSTEYSEMYNQVVNLVLVATLSPCPFVGAELILEIDDNSLNQVTGERFTCGQGYEELGAGEMEQ